MKKLYLIIFSFIFFISPVHAISGVVNIDGAAFETASFANFADVSNGYMSIVGATWVDTGSYYRSNSALYTTGSNSDGASVIFDANQTFVAGYTYVVSVIIGFSNGYPKASDSKVCIAETIGNVVTRWNNNWCVSAYVTNTTNVATYSDGTMSYTYGLLNYVFTSPVTGTSIGVDYQSSVSNESTHTFGGYKVSVISDNSNLSQSDIISAVQSSGLATAQSVQQVQTSINQIHTDINSSANNIINNQNQNTQAIIDSNKVCNFLDKSNIKTSSVFLGTTGNTVSTTDTYWGVTDFIKIDSSTEILPLSTNTSFTSPQFCFYNINKSKISCSRVADLTLNTKMTIPQDASYFRTSINSYSNLPQYQICKNGSSAVSDSINDLDSTIKNDDIDSSNTTDTLNDLSSNLPTNSVISDLLLLPVRMLQAIVNSLGGTCSSFNLGSLYGTNLVMPCIDLQSYLGSNIWTFIDLVFSGMFILVIRKKFIQIFQNITNLRTGGNEVE